MRRATLLLVAGALALAACATGERPSLGPVDTVLGGETGAAVGDAAVDPVLSLLESGGPGEFSAAYTVVRKLGPNTTTAQVVRQGEVTSVTVGDVRFLDADDDLTCSISAGICEAGIQEARISDYSVSSSFWGTAPARALRVAFARRSGEPAATTMDIGGLTATCVDVPVGPGTERYCATPSGVVAFWDTAATQVSLTAYQDTPDQTAFIVPGALPDAGAETTTG
jgi:hypothetical protein